MKAEMAQLVGQVIDGKYRIVRLLGHGGMGAVYEGENLRIRRRVAIKMLHGSVSSQDDVIRRFEREAQAAALVGSDHICEVLDLGMLADGTRYMVMEYLEGETLTARIKQRGRLLPAESIPIVLQVLEALGAAHTAGIIHRDLKPDNIFILPQKGGVPDFVKILDFGVSKFSQTGGEEMGVTKAGVVVGTPYYMSPEQARGNAAIDGRTDLYAMGVVLYQTTAGRVPYQAETFSELLFKIVLEVPPTLQSLVPDVDPEFAMIVMKAMSREPAQRFQSCAELRDALLAYRAARAGGQAPMPIDRVTNTGMRALPPQAPAGPQAWPPALDPTMPLEPSPLAGMRQSGVPLPAPAGNSAAGWGQAPGGGQPLAPMATSNAWGQASAVAPRSNAPLVAVLLGLVLLAGGGLGLGAYLVLGRAKPSEAASAAGESSASASAVTPPASASAAATASAPAEPAPVETSSAVPVASAAVKPAQTAKAAASAPKPATTSKPATSAPKPPSKPGKIGSDLGY
ncbi:MAG: serine/threonine-protein kinase [Byssovorax sp.]